MNCFNYDMQRVCETGSDEISQKKTYSININMLKQKPTNAYYQTLPFFISEYKPKQINIDFEPTRELLMKTDKNWFRKDGLRRFIIR